MPDSSCMVERAGKEKIKLIELLMNVNSNINDSGTSLRTSLKAAIYIALILAPAVGTL